MATAARYPKTVYGFRGRRNTANYSGTEGTAKNTRYRYAKPTDKAQPGLPKQLHYDIQEYELPIVDVDVERRNFPGYTEEKVYSLDEIRLGDWSGTTDTDMQTHSDKEYHDKWSYTRINNKQGSKGRSWKTNSPQKGMN